MNVTNVPGHGSNNKGNVSKANPYIRRNQMNMGMVNMERPKPSVAETKVSEPVDTDTYYEKYPWGLRITLSGDDLNKLGIDLSEYKVNTSIDISAKAFITEVSSRQSVDNAESNNSMELQITDLSLVDNDNFEQGFKDAVNED